MKFKIKYFLVVISTFSFILYVSGDGQKTKWKGKIDYENGVKVIKNPKDPLYGEISFELEEDLSIGNEEDENYLFYRIMDIKVDNEENIYVLEFGNLRIQKFDRNGNYLCTMGRQGQGPGEFQRPLQLLINEKKGTIGIRDGRKLIVFDKDGNYLDEDIAFEKYFYYLVIDSNGAIWGINLEQMGENEATADLFKTFGKLNSEGQIESTIAKYPYDIYRERMGERSVISVSTGYEYNLFIAHINGQGLIYGYSKDYELRVIDLKDNLLFRIRKEESYQKLTEEEKGKRKRVKYPEYKPFFYHVFTDTKGRIYVQRNNVRRLKNEEKEFDIFSKDGYYLYKTVFKLTPFVIKDGLFYTRIMNEDIGEVFVKRFKIKNWDQIRKEI